MEPPRVSVLGPKGTFTDEAAESYFRRGRVVYEDSISAVFERVKSGGAEYGVVPIENSSEGSVRETIDCLMNYELNIYAEIYYRIQHVLAGTGSLSDVKKIRSHPMAIKQCLGKLKIRGRIPKIITRLANGQDYSTAGAMASVARLKNPEVAAIGSRKAAEKYGLNILIDGLSDREDNETRFFVISKSEAERTGRDKTSIITAVKDKAGALYELLKIFADEGINLSKIESHPSKRKKWEYIFLIDFEGHKDDGNVAKVLKSVEREGTFYRLLGSYPDGMAEAR